jgi:serine/threonine-protein kinase RsbW
MTAPDSRKLRWLRSTADAPEVLQAVAAEMAAAGYPEDDVFGVSLALNEALLNAVLHGNGGDPAKQVRVAYHVGPTQVAVEVEDEGPGFDPDTVPDPRAPENLERLGGRGLLLMQAYLTSVRYDRQGNSVVLCKCRSAT